MLTILPERHYFCQAVLTLLYNLCREINACKKCASTDGHSTSIRNNTFWAVGRRLRLPLETQLAVCFFFFLFWFFDALPSINPSALSHKLIGETFRSFVKMFLDQKFLSSVKEFRRGPYASLL